MQKIPRRETRIHLLFAALVLLVVMVGANQQAFARDRPVLITGLSYSGDMLFCDAQKDAEEIAETYIENGELETRGVVHTKTNVGATGEQLCTSRPIAFVVIRLVASYQNDDETMNVIEVEDRSTRTAYYVIHESEVIRGTIRRTPQKG